MEAGDTISSPGPIEVKDLRGSYKLEIIPSITILAGRLVVARGGSYHILKRGGKEIVLSDLLESLKNSYDSIHMADLENITKGKPQLSSLRDATDHFDVWYDGGVNSSEEIYDPIMVGASNIVMGTKSMKNLEVLLDCFELTPNVIFEIDYHDRILSPSKEISGMGVKGLGGKVRSIGIKDIIVADFGRMESDGDLNIKLLEKLMAKGFNTYAAGNITPRDLPRLEELGVKGAIMKLESIIEERE